MKKSLIALAVAGAFAAPAFAASSNVDVYGTLRYSLDHNDVSGGSTNWMVKDQTSRVGLKGSEDLGGGLKAVWQIEQGIASTSTPTVSGGAFGDAGLRNTFVGLAGGFGTVLIGRHDTPYKLGGSADLFVDTSADAQANGAAGIIGRNGFDNRVAGTVAYVSPEFSGFHFAAAIVPGEGTAGAANGLIDAYSLVGVYANGPLKATLGYENFDKELGNIAAVTASAGPDGFDLTADDVVAAPAVAGANDKHAVKFNIAYKIGDIGLGYTYERSKDGFTAANSDTAHLASVSYGMGPITLMGQYGKFNNKEANVAAAGAQNDETRWTVGAGYALSKRTNVYAAYNTVDQKNTGAQTADVDTWTLGMNHSF